jgi:hypothetical protein
MRTHTTDDAAPLSWRPSTWLKEAGHPFSRPVLYSEIRTGRIDARKAGRNTIILTPPKQYLERLPRRLDPPFGRGRMRTAE